MLATWSILWRFALSIVRNYVNLMFMLVLPVIFLLVFVGLPRMGGTTTTIAVVDLDRTPLSQAYVDQIQHTPGYRIQQITQNEVQDTLRDLRASAVIELPKGFQSALLHGQSPHVAWTTAPNAGRDGTTALLRLRLRMQEWTQLGSATMHAAQAQGADDEWSVTAFRQGMRTAARLTPVVVAHGLSLVAGQVQAHALGDDQRAAIGFAMLFILLSVFGSTGHILTDRMRGTWNRLLASPVRRASILGGYAAGFFLVGWLQFLILYAAARVLFGVRIPMGLLQAVIVSLYVITVCGIALCVAGLARSVEQHIGLGIFVAVATSMLGGAYWPLDIEPEWMQRLAWFVPQSWAINGFKAAAMGLAQTSVALLPVAVLAAFALVFFTVGMIQLRYIETR